MYFPEFDSSGETLSVQRKGYFITTCNEVAKVIFLVLSVHQSVILSTGRGGTPPYRAQTPASHHPLYSTQAPPPGICSNLFNLDLALQGHVQIG